MSPSVAWGCAALTLALMIGYEVRLALAQRRDPSRVARSAHADLRESWFRALAGQRGSEILAVQTLRNSMMSATMTASTAVLGLMGTLTLATPSLHAGFPQATPRLAMELLLLALLFTSLVASAMAVRYFNHASFIGGMPVDSDTRRRWEAAGVAYVRRAGLLYGLALRQLVLLAPAIAFLLHPLAGPVAALGVVLVMGGFDRFDNA